MSKMRDWTKHRYENTKMNDSYWISPKDGFDKKWHDEMKAKKLKKEALARKLALESIRSKK